MNNTSTPGCPSMDDFSRSVRDIHAEERKRHQLIDETYMSHRVRLMEEFMDLGTRHLGD